MMAKWILEVAIKVPVRKNVYRNMYYFQEVEADSVKSARLLAPQVFPQFNFISGKVKLTARKLKEN